MDQQHRRRSGKGASNTRAAFFGALAMAGMILPPGGAAADVPPGIDALARQIVERSVAADRTTIAIAAFPHVDDTCSELSNFLVDELVLSFFSLPGNQLSIIERSQLDRIFSEMELSLSGAVDVNTTQELGRVHGVDTLLIGTLSNFGEDLRINARLIDTETARVYSAAAVNIPRTSALEGMMAQPAAGGCTLTPSAAGRSPPSRGGLDARASRARSFEALSAEFDMSDLEGNWSGSRTCAGAVEPRSMRLRFPSPAGLQVEYFHSSSPRGAPNVRTSLAYDFARAGDGIWFTLALAGGVSMELLARDVLYGEFVHSENSEECSLYLGKYE